jgi:hypothetical protein
MSLIPLRLVPLNGFMLGASIGWVLKRLYHPHEKAMAIAFISTVFAALVFLISMELRSAPPFVVILMLIAFSEYVGGLIFVLIGAGLLRNQPCYEQLEGR